MELLDPHKVRELRVNMLAPLKLSNTAVIIKSISADKVRQTWKYGVLIMKCSFAIKFVGADSHALRGIRGKQNLR